MVLIIKCGDKMQFASSRSCESGKQPLESRAFESKLGILLVLRLRGVQPQLLTCHRFLTAPHSPVNPKPLTPVLTSSLTGGNDIPDMCCSAEGRCCSSHGQSPALHFFFFLITSTALRNRPLYCQVPSDEAEILRFLVQKE